MIDDELWLLSKNTIYNIPRVLLVLSDTCDSDNAALYPMLKHRETQ